MNVKREDANLHKEASCKKQAVAREEEADKKATFSKYDCCDAKDTGPFNKFLKIEAKE
ncbi:hypothetical protein D3C79_1088880 [compost metagenome]